MTPLQLAATECSNREPNGACLGMDITADGRTVPLWPKKQPRCVLADGQPCPYFETALLAGIGMIVNERKASEWQEAADIYNERKQQHDSGPGEGSVERAGNDGTPRLHERATAPAHAGRRPSSGQIGARILRLRVLRREQVAHGSEIRSRCDRNSSRRRANYPLSQTATVRHGRAKANPYEDSGCLQNGTLTVVTAAQASPIVRAAPSHRRAQ
jgi:hypothetical protein